jgi:glycosyltransferase involved in cell wall biosynthesis
MNINSSDSLNKNLYNSPKITIITPTLNADSCIEVLIRSLEQQTDQNFKWLVIDGKSIDNTLNLAENAVIKNKCIFSSEDFGIYDSINKGIKNCDTSFYIVAGADDEFKINAIENFNKSIIDDPEYDFYAASWIENSKIQSPNAGSTIKHGMRSISSCHSIALLIRTDIHKNLGFYSSKYLVCADYEFVRRAIIENNKKQKVVNFISGIYSTNGMSSQNYLEYVFDMYRIKSKNNFNIVQFLLLIIRLIKY